MKSICQKHERAYEWSEGCIYCEKPDSKGAVAVLAQATPVAAPTHRCIMSYCGKTAMWKWTPASHIIGFATSFVCDEHHSLHAPAWSSTYTFEKLP